MGPIELRESGLYSLSLTNRVNRPYYGYKSELSAHKEIKELIPISDSLCAA